MPGGRQKDAIWQYFLEKCGNTKTGRRAICKICKKEIQGIVARMKTHYEECKKRGTVAIDIGKYNI